MSVTLRRHKNTQFMVSTPRPNGCNRGQRLRWMTARSVCASFVNGFTRFHTGVHTQVQLGLGLMLDPVEASRSDKRSKGVDRNPEAGERRLWCSK